MSRGEDRGVIERAALSPRCSTPIPPRFAKSNSGEMAAAFVDRYHEERRAKGAPASPVCG